MTCSEAREIIANYFDYPDNDIRRKRLDEHMRTCCGCSTEFNLWKESRLWMNAEETWSSIPEDPEVQKTEISQSVMDRIYTEEKWKMPIADQILNLNYKVRKNLTLLIALLFALFTASFIHSIWFTGAETVVYPADQFTELMPVASAVTQASHNFGSFDTMQGVPVASISDPMVLTIGQVSTNPNYLFAISILGMVAMVLIMNWLTRVEK